MNRKMDIIIYPEFHLFSGWSLYANEIWYGERKMEKRTILRSSEPLICREPEDSNKSNFLLSVTIIVIAGLLITSILSIEDENLNFQYAESAYITHAPIYINGNAQFASTAASNGWSGDGTEGNPFIIENLEIQAALTDTAAIQIVSTTVHFIIRDCSLAGKNAVLEILGGGWPAMIKMHYPVNDQSAIRLSNVNNAQISNNDLYGPYHAIMITTGSNIFVTDNSCTAYMTYYTTMAGTIVGPIPTGGNGAILCGNVYDSLIISNQIHFFGIGLYLGGSNNTIVSRNSINQDPFTSPYPSGLEITGSTSNNFENNRINAHVTLNTGSSSNIFLCNIFNETVVDDGASNRWNTSDSMHICGNYWKGWESPDSIAPFGIVDLPKEILGATGSKDYYPLTTIPTMQTEKGITLTSGDVTPTLGAPSTTVFTYSVNYTNIWNIAPASCVVFIDESPHLMSTTDTDYSDGSLFTFTTTILSDGIHYYYFDFSTSNATMRSPCCGIFVGPRVGYLPLRINSNSEFALMASANLWQGNGTETDPYIIGGHSVNATGFQDGVYIGNTTVYFVINNCTITGASNAGIEFNNVTNGNTTHCNCSNNQKFGILLNNSDFNCIYLNRFFTNGAFGVMIISTSSNNHIWNNSFIRNNGSGAVYDSMHLQAYDDGTSNLWSSTAIKGSGNYWADWVSPDKHKPFGIVDDPYLLAGSAGAQDDFPLTTDQLPPIPVPEPSIILLISLLATAFIFTRRRCRR